MLLGITYVNLRFVFERVSWIMPIALVLVPLFIGWCLSCHMLNSVLVKQSISVAYSLGGPTLWAES